MYTSETIVRMTNSVDRDQTAPLKRLIEAYTIA